MGSQAQVERSTRTSAIEPSFRIDDGLFLWTSKLVELGNLNGLVKLIRLETLTATAPTFQLERFHFSRQIPRSKNSRLWFSYPKTNNSITLLLLLFISLICNKSRESPTVLKLWCLRVWAFPPPPINFPSLIQTSPAWQITLHMQWIWSCNPAKALAFAQEQGYGCIEARLVMIRPTWLLLLLKDCSYLRRNPFSDLRLSCSRLAVSFAILATLLCDS